MTPLVSILIPCHNAEPWLAQTLESALAQTHPGCEIIVVNDGSTDGSGDIARRYTTRGVVVHTQENKGASAARNAALRRATGDWIQFLDADDLLARDKIELQLRAALAQGPQLAWCSSWFRFAGSLADVDRTPQPLSTDADPVDWLIVKIEQNRMMHPAAWLISRTLAERAGPWDESLSLDDDGEYFTRVVLASEGVRCCREAVSFYRSDISGSLSGSKSAKAWDSAFRSMDRVATALLAREDSRRTRTAAARSYERFCYDAFPAAETLRSAAARRVTELGGTFSHLPGGPRFRLLARLVGWKLARRLQLALQRRSGKSPAWQSA